MRNFLLIISILVYNPLFSQIWYSKTWDASKNGAQEEIKALKLVNDTVIFRCNSSVPNPDNFCTILGKYSVAKDSLIELKQFQNIQAGLSFMSSDENILISSQEATFNEMISVSLVDKQLDFVKTMNLKHPDSRFYSYTIKKAIEFGDKFIVGGQALDSLDKFQTTQGFYDKEKALLFIIDKDLNTDTLLTISPDTGQKMVIEDIATDKDSILYISFLHKYYTGTYYEIRKEIFGFNKQFQKIFEWIGPDLTYNASLATLIVGADGTLYVSYFKGYHNYIFALNSDASTKWECQLDSSLIQSSINCTDLIMGQNGDIIGTGAIAEALYNVGDTGYLFRISPSGQKKWVRVIRLNQYFTPIPNYKNYGYIASFNSLVELNNGDLFLGGFANIYRGIDHPLGAFDKDLWVARTDSNGCLWKNCPYIQDVITKNSYIPIVTSSNEWVIDYLAPAAPPMIRRYTFSNDSIFNGS
jgi:hypothetical protein